MGKRSRNPHRMNRRNHPCSCGSGLKYKKCHLLKKWDRDKSYREDQEKEKGIYTVRMNSKAVLTAAVAMAMQNE